MRKTALSPILGRGQAHGGTRVSASPAFTLLELLVVVTIIALILSILATAIRNVRVATKSFVCKNNLKTVGFDFYQFADEYARPYRGDSDDGRPGFHVEDFQERVYRIAEFWDGGAETELACDPARQPLMCPAAPRQLRRHAGLPCGAYAVTPAENVGVGFNMRLAYASVYVGGRPVLREVRVSPQILEHGSVPLAFDVDGQAAVQRDVLPYYSAPPAGDTGRYGSGLLWFPRSGHHGKVQVSFVGGHVLSSSRPEQESAWDWKYQPTTD